MTRTARAINYDELRAALKNKRKPGGSSGGESSRGNSPAPARKASPQKGRAARPRRRRRRFAGVAAAAQKSPRKQQPSPGRAPRATRAAAARRVSSDDEAPARGRAKPRAQARGSSDDNQFKDMKLAMEAAPQALQYLGMPPSEFKKLPPDAAIKAADALGKQAGVFEQVLKQHVSKDGPAQARVWEDAAVASKEWEEAANQGELDALRAAEREQRMVAEEARRQARIAKEAEEKSATRLQAAARGRNEREAFKRRPPLREWKFQKMHVRTLVIEAPPPAAEGEARGPSPTQSKPVRFHINRNEKLEILEATGAGRLVLSAADADGVVVVSGGVVYDSSAYAFNSRKGDGSRQPALWSGPGEYEYSFALQPLGAHEAFGSGQLGVAGGASMRVKFRVEMTLTEHELVKEPKTKEELTGHLKPTRESAAAEEASEVANALSEATMNRAAEVEAAQAASEAQSGNAVLARLDAQQNAQLARVSTPPGRKGDGMGGSLTSPKQGQQQQMYPYGGYGAQYGGGDAQQQAAYQQYYQQYQAQQAQYQQYLQQMGYPSSWPNGQQKGGKGGQPAQAWPPQQQPATGAPSPSNAKSPARRGGARTGGFSRR